MTGNSGICGRAVNSGWDALCLRKLNQLQVNRHGPAVVQAAFSILKCPQQQILPIFISRRARRHPADRAQQRFRCPVGVRWSILHCMGKVK